MLNIYNKTSMRVQENILQDILKMYSNKEVELIITNNEEIQKYNKEFRNIDNHTDVLSFPMQDMPNAPLGSIIISHDWLQKSSIEYKHSITEEMILLFTHGLLHLLGFDHEVDSGEMRREEEKIINKFSLPKSLIIRNT